MRRLIERQEAFKQRSPKSWLLIKICWWFWFSIWAAAFIILAVLMLAEFPFNVLFGVATGLFGIWVLLICPLLLICWRYKTERYILEGHRAVGFEQALNDPNTRKLVRKSVWRRILTHPGFYLLIIAFAGSWVAWAFMLDMMIHPSTFPHDDLRVAHIRATTADSLSVFIRHNRQVSATLNVYDASTTNFSGTPPINVAGPASINSSQDYTLSMRSTGLTANTSYTLKILLSDNVEYTLTARTAPAPGTPCSFKFVFGSCILPLFPYPYDMDGLGNVLQHHPDFFLFIGDFIYHDVPQSLGHSAESFNQKYRFSMDDPQGKKLLSTIPTFFMYDDHEITNNWDQRNEPFYVTARSAYDKYLGNSNPLEFSLPQPGETGFNGAPLLEVETATAPAYFNFSYGNVGFFVVDERAYRDRNSKTDGPDKTIIGKLQLKRLTQWLVNVNTTATFKFIVSGVPFGFDTSDSWVGFKFERNQLFDFIKSNNIQNVLLLSGDRHWCAVTHFPQWDLIDFSVSPIDNFWDPARPSADPDEVVLYDSGNEHRWIGVFDVDTTKSVPTATFRLFAKDHTSPSFEYEKTLIH